VHPFLGRHVVDRRGHVQRQREHLLGGQRATAPDQPSKRRAFEVLDQHVRIGALQARGKAAQYDRMSQGLERLGFAAQAAQSPFVSQEIGANQLRDRDREEAFVPDQVDLVAISPSERLEHGPAGGYLVPLGELP
jgi:hypothetical protein